MKKQVITPLLPVALGMTSSLQLSYMMGPCLPSQSSCPTPFMLHFALLPRASFCSSSNPGFYLPRSYVYHALGRLFSWLCSRTGSSFFRSSAQRSSPQRDLHLPPFSSYLISHFYSFQHLLNLSFIVCLSVFLFPHRRRDFVLLQLVSPWFQEDIKPNALRYLIVNYLFSCTSRMTLCTILGKLRKQLSKLLSVSVVQMGNPH